MSNLYRKEEESFNCEHCQSLCMILRGQTIDMRTKKKHTCKILIKKIKDGLIKPKPKRLSEFFTRSRFEIYIVCNWCHSRWVYSEVVPSEQRIYHCPNCCDKKGEPKSDFEHEKYGDVALVKWAFSRRKEIPEHLRKYLN